MISNFPIKKSKNYIKRNINQYCEPRHQSSTQFFIKGSSISLKERTEPKRKTSARDINDNKIGFQSLNKQLFPENYNLEQNCTKKPAGIKRATIIKRKLPLNDNIYFQTFEKVKEEKEKFPISVLLLPNKTFLNNFSDNRRERDNINVKETFQEFDKKVKMGEKVEGLQWETRRKAAVRNDNIQVYCQLLQDKGTACSNEECSSFVGEAVKNRKQPKEYTREVQIPSNIETSDAYLTDSYNYLFQRHVDNLNTVISQYNKPTDRTKKVHILPYCQTTNTTQIKKKPTQRQDAEDQDEEDDEEISNLQSMNVIQEQFQELNFEELNNNSNNNDIQKPVIIFNHVTSITTEKPTFVKIEKEDTKGSRSPSPLLEVPVFVETDKETLRPPL